MFSDSDTSHILVVGIAATFLFGGSLSISSRLGSLFVPADAALPAGILGGSGNLVLAMVFWAKHALVLCVFRPHRRQSALASRCF